MSINVSEQRDVFELSTENPTPFQQPFLVLHFRNKREWYIDVNGQIDNYLNNYTAVREAYLALTHKERDAKGIPDMPCNILSDGSDWQSQATPLLQGMLDGLKKHGWTVDQIYAYEGSAGPSHVLMNGAIFERVYIPNLLHTSKEPDFNKYDIDVARHIKILLGR